MGKRVVITSYDAIERLVRYVIAATEEDWRDKEERLGPIANEDDILNSATEVLYWLDALEMTRWSQDTIDALGLLPDSRSDPMPGE